MTESLHFNNVFLNPRALDASLQEADRDSNGWLLDVGDRLPRVSNGDREAVILLTPILQARLQNLTQGKGTNVASLELRLLEIDRDRKRLDPIDIAELMRHNTGHPIRVADAAHLFPNAQLNGRGPILSELVTRQIFTDKYRDGVTLAEAFLDPGGELIVSHFYIQELWKAAPSFTQFMTNHIGPHADARCHDPAQAFTTATCNPDSWPVDLDTLLSLASLQVPLKGHFSFSTESRARRETLVSFLQQNIVGNSILHSSDALVIDLSDASKVRKILHLLQDQFPELYCDPDNPADMAFHLGTRFLEGTIPDDHAVRRVLLALLDDPSVSVIYDEALANAAWRFNKKAEHPSLHFLARISPADLDHVIFAILHIDGQSYKPRGTTSHDQILGPDASGSHDRPQHQGETEPIYLSYRRFEHSPHIVLEHAYLGDHFAAESLDPTEYQPEIAVAYASGGRIVRRAETTWYSAMVGWTGTQSAAMAYAMSVFDLFPCIEVYPGRSDTEGDYPTAARFVPGDYRLVLEGEAGDYLTTGRLLARNGQPGEATYRYNTAGFPFVRGSREPTSEAEHFRLEVGLSEFLSRQDGYDEHRMLGGVFALSLQWSPVPVAASFSFDHASRFSARYDVEGTAWAEPYFLGAYLYNPFSPSVREVPQMGVDFYVQSERPIRSALSVDLFGVQGGIMDPSTTGLRGFIQLFLGSQLFGAFDEQGPFGGGLYVRSGLYLMFQRYMFQIELGTEGRCETNLAYQLRQVVEGAGCAWFPLNLSLGGRFRRHY